jgi:hypothetical protein
MSRQDTQTLFYGLSLGADSHAGLTCELLNLILQPAAAAQGDFVVAFLDIVGPELNKPYTSSTVKSDTAPQLKHLLRQALLSCSGGVRLDEEVNGPMQLLDIQVNKSAGGAWCAPVQGMSAAQVTLTVYTHE